MATYYWVGGSGSWNISDARNWSSTSGGAGGTPDAANVTSTTWSLLGGVGTSSTTPTSGGNDDGFWTLALPFSITYLGKSYSTIYVGTNSYITFDAGYTRYSPGAYTSIGVNTFLPAVPKIYLGVSDYSCQRIYYQTSGVAPDRTFWVRYEGSAGTGGTLGSPNRVYEATFYENAPSQIDIAYGIMTATGTYVGVYNPETQLATLSLTANTAQRITTSGSGGVGVPTSVDDVIFDANSNATSYNVTVTGLQNCRDLIITSGPSSVGNVVFVGTTGPTITNVLTAFPNGTYINGNLTITTSRVSRTSVPIFRFTGSGTFSVNSGNNDATGYAIFNGGTRTLSNAFSAGTYIYVNSGTFNSNGYSVTTPLFYATGSTSRTINLGNSLVTLTSSGTVWDFTTVTNLSFLGANSTIRLSDTSTAARTFVTGNQTYGNLIIGGSTGVSNLTFTGSGTFNRISSEKTVNYGVIFTAGTITTVGAWTANGANASSNTRIRITSTSTSPFTLIKSGGGNVFIANANISYSNAWPTLTWNAVDSTNYASNTNWSFVSSSNLSVGGTQISNFFLIF